MNISAQGQKVLVLFNQQRFISPLKEVPRSSLPFVEPNSVGNKEMPHEFTEVGQVRLHNQVKVVGHQDVAYDSDVIDLGAILQSAEKCGAVSIGDKYILFAITAVHYVVVGSRIFNPQRSGHESQYFSKRECLSKQKI
jgi:hypothetical protein